jgi:hypothetical protein
VDIAQSPPERFSNIAAAETVNSRKASNGATTS